MSGFFFNDTATTESYTLSLHDALPIYIPPPPASAYGLTGDDAAWVERRQTPQPGGVYEDPLHFDADRWAARPRTYVDCTAPALPTIDPSRRLDRKSTRLNSSHANISYAVFCLKKKK